MKSTILKSHPGGLLLSMPLWWFLLSCQPDLKTIESLTRTDEGPVETAWEIEVVYSERADLRMVLEAPLLKRFAGEKNYMEFPGGFLVVFYDSLQQVTSRMSANYAISYEDDERIEARNDVVVVNELGEQLNTEQLIWDQQKEIIFSEKFVRITTEDEVLYGEGFEADERFMVWRIKRPGGGFNIDLERESGDPPPQSQADLE